MDSFRRERAWLLEPDRRMKKGSPTVEPLNEQRSLLLRCYSLFRKMNPHNSGQNSITLGLETKSTLLVTLLSGIEAGSPGLYSSTVSLRAATGSDGAGFATALKLMRNMAPRG